MLVIFTSLILQSVAFSNLAISPYVGKVGLEPTIACENLRMNTSWRKYSELNRANKVSH